MEWAFDTDPEWAQLKAESKFHEKLSEAALSDTNTHAVSLLAVDGRLVDHKCYRHPAVSDETATEEVVPE